VQLSFPVCLYINIWLAGENNPILMMKTAFFQFSVSECCVFCFCLFCVFDWEPCLIGSFTTFGNRSTTDVPIDGKQASCPSSCATSDEMLDECRFCQFQLLIANVGDKGQPPPTPNVLTRRKSWLCVPLSTRWETTVVFVAYDAYNMSRLRSLGKSRERRR
jgi:hypothetical protein